MLFWSIDWGMAPEQFEEVRQMFLAQKRPVAAHRLPTEDSYNELCDMILRDYDQAGSTWLPRYFLPPPPPAG